jgi:hypothetical protein
MARPNDEGLPAILVGTYGLNDSSKKHKKKWKWISRQRGRAGTLLNDAGISEFLGG